MKIVSKDTVQHSDFLGKAFTTILAEKGNRSTRRMLVIKSVIMPTGRINCQYQIILNGKISKETDRLDSAIYWYNNANLK